LNNLSVTTTTARIILTMLPAWQAINNFVRLAQPRDDLVVGSQCAHEIALTKDTLRNTMHSAFPVIPFPPCLKFQMRKQIRKWTNF
jgi:hypothetical protein